MPPYRPPGRGPEIIDRIYNNGPKRISELWESHPAYQLEPWGLAPRPKRGAQNNAKNHSGSKGKGENATPSSPHNPPKAAGSAYKHEKAASPSGRWPGGNWNNGCSDEQWAEWRSTFRKRPEIYSKFSRDGPENQAGCHTKQAATRPVKDGPREY